MASRYAVETVFKLIDNITPKLDQIGIKGKVVGNALKKDFLKTQDSLSGIGSKLQSVAKYAVAAGAALIGVGIAVAAKQFVEFDQAATAATAKFKDLDVTSASYAQSLEAIKQKAREVAAVTEYNAVDTAGALEKMAMAGLTSEQSMAMLKGTTNLATAASMDLTTAVDIATDTLGAFRLLTDEAGNALDAAGITKNMDRVSDVMAKTTNMFNTDMSMMFESIKKGAPQFADAGQSIETFSALVGVMANSGIKGSESGTALRNIMLRLAAPTDQASKLMGKLGVQVKDSAGNYLDVIDIIGQFEAATKSMGSAERAAAMSTIFGSRSVSAMNILMAEGSDALRRYRTDLENAGGAAANIAEAMRGSIKNKIEVLKSALTELGFKFIDAFQAKGVSVIDNLTDAVSKFDPAPIIAGLSTAANIIIGLVKVIYTLRYIIMGCAIAWGIYKAAMIAAVIVSKVMAFVKIVQGLMAAQQGLNVVQAIYNALLLANPIGLIIAAVGILIGLIIALVMNWDKVCAAMSAAWEWIKKIAAIIWDGLVGAFKATVDWIKQNSEKALALITIFTGPFGFIISIVKELKDNWGLVVEAFKSDGILGALKKIGGIILSAVLAPIQGLLEVLAKIPGVDKLLGPAITKMQEFRNTLKGIDTAEQASASAVHPSVQAAMRTATTTSGVSAVSPSVAPATVQPTTPMTTAQQSAYYSRTESRETVDINVRPEQGAAASVNRARPAPRSRVRVNSSGGN